ncbi:hypothetical protein A9Q86_07695 [Flavobacteriales bacterium 33_180_T64]|nr:hypothetical protein A9Q86_07695 [Flavobacteriales bacterium 33_180_T64]
MKKNILVICVLLFLSCKEEKKEKINSRPDLKQLIVKVDLKTTTEDVFKVIMNNIKVDEFQEKNVIIRETIPVTSNYENITASFDTNNFSNNIHIDLGKTLKNVKFNTIEFIYGANVLLITKDNFNEFLKVNKFAKFNEDDFSVTTKKEGKNQYSKIILKQSAIKFLIKERK